MTVRGLNKERNVRCFAFCRGSLQLTFVREKILAREMGCLMAPEGRWPFLRHSKDSIPRLASVTT